MPLDRITPHALASAPADLHALVADLNARMRHQNAEEVIALAQREIAGLCLVSSFGAESVALLHLAARVDRNFPVLFIDTEMLFAETLDYQRDVATRLGLSNLRVVKNDRIAATDSHGDLHRTDPDACCTLRKTVPLNRALMGRNGWMTGRKRFQSQDRAGLAHFEVDGASQRIKVNPLAYWRAAQVAAYIDENHLPRHPLVARGYRSIGCAPCTSPVAPDEPTRAGRWRGSEKNECGIHFVNGKAMPVGERA